MSRRICFFIAVIFLFSWLAGGCSDGSGQVFRMDIFSQPESLDPQTAAEDDQYLILLNTMEGLLKTDEDQQLVCGAAQSYTVSDDRLKYTFTLRDDMLWSDGKTAVTAYDYEFAFCRLLDPQTRSPHAEDFLSIQGANESLNGWISPRDIGVKATNAKTLEITLNREDPVFLPLLATCAAMPCNEIFFNSCRGKYGVSSEFLLFNGPFTVSNWSDGEYIQLRKNESYCDADSVKPSSVRLYIRGENDPVRLVEGNVDLAQVPFEKLKDLGRGYKTESFVNTTWAVFPNLQNSFLSNLNVRLSLAAGIDRESLSGDLNPNYVSALWPVPPAISYNGSSYRQRADEIISPAAYQYTAKEYLSLGLKELQTADAPPLTLICPEGNDILLPISKLQRQWQDSLGIFINIQPLPPEDLARRVKEKDYDLVFYSVSAAYDGPESLINLLYGGESISGWQDEGMSDILQNARDATSAQEALENFTLAERRLLENGVVIPLFYETTYISTAPNVDNLRLSPFGCHVYFEDGTKK